MEQLRFAVLGPVRVWRGGSELVLPSRYHRLLLALLIARAGRLVEMSELLDLLWDGEQPPTAVNMVHRYVGLLRRVLEPGLPARSAGRMLIRDVGGYRLLAGPSTSDLLDFRERIADARQLAAAGDDAAALDAYLDGLGLSRGRCAAGLGAAVESHPEFVAIEQEYLAAVRDAARTAVAAGGAARILPVLREAAVRSPLDEALLAELVLVLAADGKQAEAIALYAEVRARLVEELGVDPGPELRDAYRAVLRHSDQDAGPDRSAESPAAVTPAQLPSDLRVFAGRTTQLADAVATLTDHRIALPILAIDGMPGVGKTALAVHAAHRVAAHFPDGQLYVDLHGFHPDGRGVDPSEALQGFLSALGVNHTDIPASLESRSALYRSALTGRRVLVVLDNARGADQVRPLLPGTPGNAVLITSRGRLSGLATGNGAVLRSLDVLSAQEARQCVADRVETGRAVPEPVALAEIVELCGRLPLALAIVAARATAEPDRSLAEIAVELRWGQGTLEAFSDEGLDRDLRSVFDWSYRLLSPPAARMLRLLAGHPGPDITVPALASLIGAPVGEAREQLHELLRTRLVDRFRPGRFRLHDLVRAYAAELSAVRETAAEQDAARQRIESHYLLSAHAAGSVLRPHYAAVDQMSPPAGVTPETYPDRRTATAWFESEHQTIRAIIAETARLGNAATCWRLALLAKEFYSDVARWHDWEQTAAVGLAAASAAGDILGMAHSHRSLAGARMFLADKADSIRHLSMAAELFERCGDGGGRAQVLMNLGFIAQAEDDHPAAVDLLRQALVAARSAGQRQVEVTVLTMLADGHLAIGEAETAERLAVTAARLGRELHDEINEERAMTTLAWIRQNDGRFVQAIRIRQYYVDEHRRQGNLVRAAYSSVQLGDTLYASGDVDGAYQLWTRAAAGPDPFEPAATEARRRLAHPTAGEQLWRPRHPLRAP